MKPKRNRTLWFARGVISLLGVLALSLPVQALADGVIGDTVDEVTGSAGDVTDPITEPVDEVVEPVTETVDDAVGEVTVTVDGAVGEVTETVDGAVGEVTETVDGAADAISDGVSEGAGGSEQGIADTQGEADGSRPSATSVGDTAEGGGAQPAFTSGSGRAGIRFRLEFSRDVLGPWVPSPEGAVDSEAGQTSEDPCVDAQLVCLGLLYGMGEFADGQTQVLNFLATTGIGVIALMMLASGLGIAGSMALLGSRSGSAATAG